ncbi:hypothetical protein evm_006513 [Chilo suppressalis]|nr:hypothetical protein evm_006513 [Chilo suppressalis]
MHEEGKIRTCQLQLLRLLRRRLQAARGVIVNERTPINVATAGEQAFPMDGIGRLGHDPPRPPSADWWVLTTADAAGTNALKCLPKHGGTLFFLIQDRRFLVTHPITNHCESCLTSTIAAERANHLHHRTSPDKYETELYLKIHRTVIICAPDG